MMNLREDTLNPDNYHLTVVTINEQPLMDIVSHLNEFDSPSDIFDSLEFPGEKERLNFIFFFNVVNFCFWNNEDWKVDIEDATYSRTSAMVKALYRGYRNCNFDFTNLTYQEFREGFEGNGNLQFFNERFIFLEACIGKLNTAYGGDFANVIKQSENDSVLIVENIARDFPSFDDIYTVDGKTYPFFKRAQICVQQLSRYIPIKNLDSLSGFSDYRVPQILRHLGVLEYSEELSSAIDNLQPIERYSHEEFEIRLATLKVIEMLRRRYAQMYGQDITAGAVDSYLWLLAKEKSDVMKPHHRTPSYMY